MRAARDRERVTVLLHPLTPPHVYCHSPTPATLCENDKTQQEAQDHLKLVSSLKDRPGLGSQLCCSQWQREARGAALSLESHTSDMGIQYLHERSQMSWEVATWGKLSPGRNVTRSSQPGLSPGCHSVDLAQSRELWVLRV